MWLMPMFGITWDVVGKAVVEKRISAFQSLLSEVPSLAVLPTFVFLFDKGGSFLARQGRGAAGRGRSVVSRTVVSRCFCFCFCFSLPLSLISAAIACRFSRFLFLVVPDFAAPALPLLAVACLGCHAVTARARAAPAVSHRPCRPRAG